VNGEESLMGNPLPIETAPTMCGGTRPDRVWLGQCETGDGHDRQAASQAPQRVRSCRVKTSPGPAFQGTASACNRRDARLVLVVSVLHVVQPVVRETHAAVLAHRADPAPP
jgi:hypothetical protein